MTTERKWISPAEAAVLLNFSVSGIRKLIGRGEIPAVRLGRAVRIPIGKLEAKLEVAIEKQIRNH